MASPTTIQEGQGLAQIFQGNMAADVYAYQQQLRAQQEAERKKKADLAAKELSGQFEALSKKNIFETRDTDAFRGKIDDIRTKYAGKWEELYKGDTPLRRDLEKDMLDVSLWADQSAASKKELQGIWKDAFQDNADKYTDAQRATIENLMTTPGAFEVPYKQLIPFENIDIETHFMENAAKPAYEEAAKRFSTDNSWKGLQNYGSIQQTKLPEETVEEYWSHWLSDPKLQNALYHRYGAEAEAAGMELNEYVKKNTPYYDRLKVDKKKTVSGLIKDSGDDKAFNPGLISTISRDTKSIIPGSVLGEAEQSFPYIPKSPVSNAPFYPVNFPVTIQTGSGGIDWSTGQPMPKDWVGSGTVAGFAVVPVKNNKISKEGTNQVVSIVKDSQGNAIAVPVEQVINQGKSKGYDVENIVNGLLQSSGSNNSQFKGVPKGGF